MPKLPPIYKNMIQKEIHNNEKVYYGKENNKTLTPKKVTANKKEEIESFIDEIFNKPTYSFNIPLKIYTKDNTYDTSLIAKANGKVITFDNDIIPIADIITIEKSP